MNLQSYIKKIDTKEVITCVLLIVVGYMTAQLFMRKYNGFRVGGQNSCPLGSDLTCKLGTFAQRRGGGAPNPDPCNKVKADDCNKSWWQSESNGAGNKPIGVACKYDKDKCITPGTGFKNINGCPTKSCDGSPPPPPSSGGNSPPPPSGGNSPPPPPPPPPTVSCSSTGTWTYYADKCLINGSTVQNQSYNDDCKKLTNCKLTTWDKPVIWLTIIIPILILIGIGIAINLSEKK